MSRWFVRRIVFCLVLELVRNILGKRMGITGVGNVCREWKIIRFRKFQKQEFESKGIFNRFHFNKIHGTSQNDLEPAAKTTRLKTGRKLLIFSRNRDYCSLPNPQIINIQI